MQGFACCTSSTHTERDDPENIQQGSRKQAVVNTPSSVNIKQNQSKPPQLTIDMCVGLSYIGHVFSTFLSTKNSLDPVPSHLSPTLLTPLTHIKTSLLTGMLRGIYPECAPTCEFPINAACSFNEFIKI